MAIDGDLNDVNPLTTVGALPIPLTVGTLTEIPLTGVLPNLIPGDYVALNFERVGKVKLLVVGMRYDYVSTALNPADITALQADVATLQSNVVTLQTENASQASTIASQATTIAALVTENVIQTTDITALQTKNTDQDNTIASQAMDILDLQAKDVALMNEDGLQNGFISTLQADSGNLLTTFAGVTRTGNDIFFDGVNVRIRSGSGGTDGAPGIGASAPNGLGNLIVGYDEARPTASDKSGSHNLVVGERHNYSSHGGLVAGFNNTVSGINASVIGGESNEASGTRSSVSGGFTNNASNILSSVGGGFNNEASGQQSSVSAGDTNTASGFKSSVIGGFNNEASGTRSSISGGNGNTASGDRSSVSGGFANEASGLNSSVSGGVVNEASGLNSSVSGGRNHDSSGDDDWRAGSLFEDL